MITNFHLPESTLIMLVSAFAGYEHTMTAYDLAVKEKYRFFSFGDAMMIFMEQIREPPRENKIGKAEIKMKITMLFGSPHKQGTTNVLAEAFMKGAQEAGHEVTRLNLAQMKIGGCMACDYCSRTKQGCIQKDDMQQVEPAVRQA